MKVSRAGQNDNFSDTFPCNKIYHLTVEIPKEIFIEDYPIEVVTLGDRIRKTRMDAGLQIKQLAEMLGVTDDTVINWEIRCMNPSKRYHTRIDEFLSLQA